MKWAINATQENRWACRGERISTSHLLANELLKRRRAAGDGVDRHGNEPPLAIVRLLRGASRLLLLRRRLLLLLGCSGWGRLLGGGGCGPLGWGAVRPWACLVRSAGPLRVLLLVGSVLLRGAACGARAAGRGPGGAWTAPWLPVARAVAVRANSVGGGRRAGAAALPSSVAPVCAAGARRGSRAREARGELADGLPHL